MTSALPVAVTIGDAAGIGPELSLKAALDPGLTAIAPVLLVGSVALLRRVAATLDLAVDIVEVVHPAETGTKPGTAYVFDVPGLDAEAVVPGVLSAACGEAAVQTIRAATRLALDGLVSAVASAPTNKAAFNAAGHHYEGQTEIFAELTGATQFHTVLVGGPLRVSLVSAHCSMTEAINRVKADRVEWILRQLDETLRGQFGMTAPRIGVAGLNPHAGENGVLGMEEIDEVIPVTTRLRGEGMDVTDPLAADSLFDAAERGRYDAVLAMYHDQGTIPLKKYGYVTYAAGLPIVRTTAGHGTAFDIAWTGKADGALLIRAITLAAELGIRRQSERETASGESV
jgi:4-hydroxythreonine-4-phosphate dehydrogenase